MYNYNRVETWQVIDREKLDAYRNAMAQFTAKELDRVEVHYSTYKKLKNKKPQNIWTVYGSYNPETKRVIIKYTEDVTEIVNEAIKAEERWNKGILEGQISMF